MNHFSILLIQTFVRMDHNDVYMSYLPLAHVMERVLAGLTYSVGGR